MKSRAMKKIVALVIIAALAVTMAVTLAACNDEGLGSGDIAILVPNADHGWTGAVMSFAQEAAEEINAEGEYSVRVITASDAANQISQIDDIAANKNYGSVVILPYDNSVEAALTRLANAGIPFIMVDRVIDSLVDDAVATVKGDNEAIGRKTAERFLANGLSKDDKILIIPGDLSSVPEMRNAGFKQALKNAGWTDAEINAAITELDSTGWSRAKGRELFENWINATTAAQYDFVFTHDSEISMGIFEALKGAAIDDAVKAAFLNHHVNLAASSGLEESYQVLRGTHPADYSKELAGLADYFDVTYPPEMIKDGVNTMVEYLTNGSVAEKNIIIDVEVVDAENVDQFKGFN